MPEHAGRKPARNKANLGPILPAAKREPGPAFDGPARNRLEAGVGADFSQVRVHGGRASAEAAERIGARAFTIGQDIYLGAEAHRLTGVARNRLLVHEAVHTVQQGAHTCLPDSLPVSTPGDAGEREAHAIADAVASGGSPSLAIRRHRLAVQRDLAATHPVTEGEFSVDLKAESHPGAKSGMSGSITFLANDKAPDSTLIKLLQIVRLIDSGTGTDYVWTGGEANRNKVMTKAAPGVTPGFFVDHQAASVAPRKAKSDPAVSQYYRDYWPNPKNSQDGSKKGKAVKGASLWDYPGWNSKCQFRFETAAKDAVGGHIYGTLRWGFDLTDPAKGKVENEFAKAADTESATFTAAGKAFDEFYRNPGSSTAPTK
ncbi:DUF4157 domain-containing protein [Amycolatopsis anabasis]|uniref:eCIS core domain-containing protein n=1 Tax=Amycolatopsis anabasis TaxID=1840409 RepID=UPI00131BEBAC|nr:DUF4157 domain-containing protein [Amycolatopsis anabasis]